MSHDPSICTRCGVCCMLAVRVNERPVAVPELACRYLKDVGGGCHDCTVYEERFEVAPWCLTVERALEEDVLAADCPYRQGEAAGVGPVALHPRLVERLRGPIARAMATVPLPAWADPQSVARFATRAREEEQEG